MAVSLREVVSFGRYEPLFRIASGGMAEVYAARIRGEAGFQKLVAVKRMHPHLATDATFVDMFLNEARLAANIASPYVVQTLDLGRGTDGSLYIVMELVVGLSLASLQEDHPDPLPVPIAIEILAQAAQGLDDAYEATTPAGDALGLIHRDISPHNILLGIDGRSRVTDFGIAHAIHRPREETNLKELKGKFAYMSPEQTRLAPLDRRSDLFSLGVVGWELLVGRRLFADNDPAASITNVRGAPIPPPHREVPSIPPAVSQVLLRALERDPTRRFATGADFSHELRQVGRSALREPATRREVGAFVRSAGGEELQRLRRLIRLGTEGADEAAIEAVKPGATRVLAAENLSGVARVGTGQKRVTAVLDEAPPSLSVVMLAPDDEPSHTAEVDVLSRREVPTALLVNAPSTRAPADPGPTRNLRKLLRRPTPPSGHAPEGPTRAWERVPSSPAIPSEPPTVTERRRRPSRVWIHAIAIAIAMAIVLSALGVAAALLWPSGETVVPLPEAPEELSELRSDPVTVAPPPLTATGREPAPPVERIEEPPATEPSEESELVAPPDEGAEAPPPSRAARRRARRGRRRAAPVRQDLMPVEAFDRQRR